uniref:ATP synthase subunit a n=1 Tax=Perna canaliculus TaxID=38949 RepID=A0A2I6RMB4_PERCI|nr:ATP synthase F0 subunit 6 [Perna canaliculus]AUN88091.1 ATP synthase F0 subunit 6 [Perna canaliculus]QPD06644.1 ATP synthase F0 subunit 6 [Perna canaliculus]QPD06657.1 ATP synthase F0 subunit 6 [Perna canaliculus]UJM44244.1 ATP synthase F0 subunit 6 [Perna canaliculus]
MLMDVFSMFDDYNFNTFEKSWYFVWGYSLFLPLFIISSSMWLKMSSIKLMYSLFLQKCMKLISESGSGMYLSGFPLLVASMFSIMLSVNVSNSIPYFFSVSAHFSFGFTFASVIWLCLIMSSIFTSFIQNMALLVPSGCPEGLAPFMVLLEIITNLLRPITLIIRLAMNMATGKVIMLLLGNAALNLAFSFSVLSTCGFVVISVLGFAIFSLEVAVSFIQSYIFCTLLCLYADEHSK